MVFVLLMSPGAAARVVVFKASSRRLQAQFPRRGHRSEMPTRHLRSCRVNRALAVARQVG